MKIDKKKISGLSLLEALVSTAIIGIGFVAIFQMTNYSVQSIYTSGERTKANYLTNMIAEDVIGHKNVTSGSAINFSDHLFDNTPELDFCADPKNNSASADVGNVYGDGSADGALMKTNKWAAIFNSKDYLNCKGANERRSFRMFKLRSQHSLEPNAIENTKIKDDLMYIGRIQINLNDGKKRKYLYFQTDYVLKP